MANRNDPFDIDFPDPSLPAGQTSKASDSVLGPAFKAGLRQAALTGGRTFQREVSLATPHATAAAREIFQTIDDFRTLGRDFSTQVAKPIGVIRHATAKLLPHAGKFLPPKLQKRLQDLADRIDVEAEATPESEERRRAGQIESEMSELFKTQVQQTQLGQEESRVSKHLDRSLDSIRHTKMSKLAARTAAGIEAIVKFQASTFTTYIKKDLELKYHHLFVAKDTLAALTTTARLLEIKLEEIKHNTGLSDVQKLQSDPNYQKSKRRPTVLEKISNYRSDLMTNIKNNFTSSIVGALEMVAMGTSMGAEGLEMTQGMDFDENGMPSKDDKNAWRGKLSPLIGQALGAAGGLGGGKFLSRGFLKRFAPILDDIDSRMEGAKVKTISRLQNLKQQWQFEGGIKGLLGGFLPSMTTNDTIDNELFDKGSTPSVFDNASRLALVEVIPGWLGLIHKELRSTRLGQDVPELVFNEAKRSFTSIETYKTDVANRALGDPAYRSRNVDLAVGTLKGAFIKNTGDAKAFSKQVQDDIRLIFMNLALGGQIFEPKQLQAWLVDESNVDGLYNPRYTRLAFSELTEERARTAVTHMLRAVLKEDGTTVDHFALSQMNRSFLRQIEEDKYRQVLPDIVNVHGKGRYFMGPDGFIDARGTIRKSAIAKGMLSGDAASTDRTVEQAATSYGERRDARDASMTQFNTEFGEKIASINTYVAKLRNRVTTAFGMPDMENLMDLTTYLETKAATIQDPERKASVTAALTEIKEVLASGPGTPGNTAKVTSALTTVAADVLKINVASAVSLVKKGKGAISTQIDKLKKTPTGQKLAAKKDILAKLTVLSNVLLEKAKTNKTLVGLYTTTQALIKNVTRDAVNPVQADAVSQQIQASAGITREELSGWDKAKRIAVNVTGDLAKGAASLYHAAMRDPNEAPSTGLSTYDAYEQYVQHTILLEHLDTNVRGIFDHIRQKVTGGTPADPAAPTPAATVAETPEKDNTLSLFFDSFTNYRMEQVKYTTTVTTLMQLMYDRLVTLETGTQAPMSRTRQLFGIAGEGVKGTVGAGLKGIGWAAKKGWLGAKKLGGKIFGPHPHLTDVLKSVLGLGGSALTGAGTAIGGTAKGLGSMIGGFYKGAGRAIGGTLGGLLGGSGEEDDPFEDIWIRGTPIDPANPILSKRTQQKGVFFASGKLVERSSDITEPVFVKPKMFARMFKKAAPECVLTQEDIANGLVDVNGKTIAKRSPKRKYGRGGILRDVLGGIGSLLRKTAETGIGGAGDIFSLYTGMLKMVGKGLAKGAGWLFNTVTGRGGGSSSDAWLEHIFDLIDRRTWGLNAFIASRIKIKPYPGKRPPEVSDSDGGVLSKAQDTATRAIKGTIGVGWDKLKRRVSGMGQDKTTDVSSSDQKLYQIEALLNVLNRRTPVDGALCDQVSKLLSDLQNKVISEDAAMQQFEQLKVAANLTSAELAEIDSVKGTTTKPGMRTKAKDMLKRIPGATKLGRWLKSLNKHRAGQDGVPNVRTSDDYGDVEAAAETADPMVLLAQKIYELLDQRTKDLDVFIAQKMGPREGTVAEQEAQQTAEDAADPLQKKKKPSIFDRVKDKFKPGTSDVEKPDTPGKVGTATKLGKTALKYGGAAASAIGTGLAAFGGGSALLGAAGVAGIGTIGALTAVGTKRTYDTYKTRYDTHKTDEQSNVMDQELKNKEAQKLLAAGVPQEQVDQHLATTDPVQRDKLYRTLKAQYSTKKKGDGLDTSSSTPTTTVNKEGPTAPISPEAKAAAATAAVGTSVQQTGAQQADMLAKTVEALNRVAVILESIKGNTGVLPDISGYAKTISEKKPEKPSVVVQQMPATNTRPPSPLVSSLNINQGR